MNRWTLDWESFRAWREAVSVSDPFGEYIRRSQVCIDMLIDESGQR